MTPEVHSVRNSLVFFAAVCFAINKLVPRACRHLSHVVFCSGKRQIRVVNVLKLHIAADCLLTLYKDEC